MTQNLIEAITELTEPIISSEGLELIDVEYQKESRGWVLRFYVDTEGGVTINHCSRLSQQIGDVLEVKDIIPHGYVLEVSSPGLNRILKREKDFIGSIGKIVKVKTFEPIEQRKNFQGTLLDCSQEQVRLKIDSQDVIIPLSLISKAQSVYHFPDSSGKKQKKRR
jgi:ribosome maturation factor RimP